MPRQATSVIGFEQAEIAFGRDEDPAIRSSQHTIEVASGRIAVVGLPVRTVEAGQTAGVAHQNATLCVLIEGLVEVAAAFDQVTQHIGIDRASPDDRRLGHSHADVHAAEQRQQQPAVMQDSPVHRRTPKLASAILR